MATKTRGYSDAYHLSRVNHIGSASAYPTAIATPFIGLYLGSVPLSDGSGNTDTARTAVTFAAAAQDTLTGRWYIQPTAAVSITPATSGEAVGWGLYGASSGGSPVYVDDLPAPFRVTAGVAVSIPAAALRIWAEGTN